MPGGRPRTARRGAAARRGRTGSSDHDPLAGRGTRGPSTGPAPGERATPSGSGGSPGGTAQKNGIVVYAGNSGTGRLSRTTSRFPRATTPPRSSLARPARPRRRRSPACRRRRATSLPARACGRSRARTRWPAPASPLLKRNPLRSVNAYVLRSRETRRICGRHLRLRAGTRPAAACPGRRAAGRTSGRAAPSRAARYESAGSIVSKLPGQKLMRNVPPEPPSLTAPPLPVVSARKPRPAIATAGQIASRFIAAVALAK